MARKSRDYAGEYARRIAKATAAGKTRQQARGHKAREHVERREKEVAKYGMTISQLRSVQKFVDRRQSLQPSISFFLDGDKLDTWVRQHGFDQFTALRTNWERQRRKYKNAPRPKGEVQIEDLYEDVDTDDLEPEWLYYH